MSTMIGNMGQRSTWLQSMIPLEAKGLYILDRKIEAIVNDVQRLGIEATVIDFDEDYVGNALVAQEIEPMEVIQCDIVNNFMDLQDKTYDFVSMGTIYPAIKSLPLERYDFIYGQIMRSLKDNAIVQFKENKYYRIERIMFESWCRRNMGVDLFPNKEFDLPHQHSTLWMYIMGNKEVSQ